MLRTCSVCRRQLELGKFRLVSKTTGKRDYRCNPCFNRQRRQLTWAKRSKALRTFFTEVKEAKSERRVTELVESVCRTFGGMEKLAAAIHEAITSAPLGSRQRMAGLTAMMRLMEAPPAPPPQLPNLTPEDLRGLSDEELQVVWEYGHKEVFGGWVPPAHWTPPDCR